MNTGFLQTPTTRCLVLCAFAAAGMIAESAYAQDCNRECLHTHLQGYLSALAIGDPARVDLSHARMTENGVEIHAREGVWSTSTGLGSYHIEVADPVTGQVGFIGDLHEGDSSTMLAVRLKISAGAITEVESIVGRASIPGNVIMEQPRASLLDVAPASERISRAAMLATAHANFVGHLGGEKHFGADCERVENRKKMTNNPGAAKIGCDFTFDTLDSVDPQRFLIIDEERQLVMGVFLLNWYGGESCKNNSRRARPCPAPTGLLSAEVMDVSSGEIHHAEVVCAYTGYKASTGWK